MVLTAKLRTYASLTDDMALLAYGATYIGAGLPMDPSIKQDLHRNPFMSVLVPLREDYQRRWLAAGGGKIVTRDLIVRQMYRKKIDMVQAALKHTQADVRWAAICVVADRNLHCEAELIDLLSDTDQDVRQAARLALISFSHGLDLGPEAGAAEKDRTESVREWRLWWEAKRLGNDLVRTKGENRDELLTQLRDSKGVYYTLALAEAIPGMTGDERKRAQDALAERLTRMTAKTLADKLAEENREIRRAAVRAVLSKGGTDNVANLIPLLRDRNLEVATIAHKALRELCGEDFGPDDRASDAERLEAVKKWSAWWKSHHAAREKLEGIPKQTRQ
jgi:hypothetical protein